MVIKESQMISTKSASNILNELSYLDESAAQYHAAMVPVVENSSIGGYIVRLEDMVSFAEANAIEDLGYALSLVCEASEIEPNKVVFSVQAESILLDEEMEQLATDIANEGVAIVGVHASSAHPACQLTDIAINSLIESAGEDTSVLEALVNEDWNFFTEADDKKEEPKAQAPRTENDLAFEARNKQSADVKLKRAHAKEVFGGDMGDGEQSAIQKLVDKVKSGTVNGRDALAKIADRLNTYLRNIQGEMAKDPSKKGVLTKIKSAIVNALEIITRKLHNVTQSTRGNIEKQGFQTKFEAEKK